MLKKIVYLHILSFIILITSVKADDTTETKFYVEKPDSNLLTDALLDPPQKYSPLKAMALSAIIPGAGQFYCGRKTRGGVFLGSEIIIGSIALFRYRGVGEYLDAQKSYEESFSQYYQDSLQMQFYLNQNDPLFEPDSLFDKKNLFYQKQFSARSKRKTFKHFIGWGTGIYLTNILDALASSKHFYDDNPRKPGVAAGLSAIPGLGLGQIYNGSYQKAGLLMTTQVMLLYMAIDKNKLGNYCLKIRDDVELLDHTYTFSSKSIYTSEWEKRYSSEIKKRNMYLWYFVLFYFYGIFDAAVDAHLHDKRAKVRLTPLADPVEKEVSMNISFDLKSRRK